jgi:hypothetical protein
VGAAVAATSGRIAALMRLRHIIACSRPRQSAARQQPLEKSGKRLDLCDAGRKRWGCLLADAMVVRPADQIPGHKRQATTGNARC